MLKYSIYNEMAHVSINILEAFWNRGILTSSTKGTGRFLQPPHTFLKTYTPSKKHFHCVEMAECEMMGEKCVNVFFSAKPSPASTHAYVFALWREFFKMASTW
jgi:hypothetical protein